MRRVTTSVLPAMCLASALLGAGVGDRVAASVPPDSPPESSLPPAPDPAVPSVVAQQIVALSGVQRWDVENSELEDRDDRGGDHPTFLTVSDGAVVVSTDDGREFEVGDHESVLLDGPFAIAPIDGSASITEIALLAAESGADEDDDDADPFDVAGAEYDVELIEVHLEPAGTVALADPGPVPMLLFAPEGGLLVTSDLETVAAELTAEVSAQFDGSLTVINAGLDRTTLLVARLTPLG